MAALQKAIDGNCITPQKKHSLVKQDNNKSAQYIRAQYRLSDSPIWICAYCGKYTQST